MLDVHPPHHPTHTWKDFFIHIATISVGLLIAIGLEQMVEYVHHQRQLSEFREQLRLEREQNRKNFAANTAMFRYLSAMVQNDLLILRQLEQHPGSPEEKLPGTLVYSNAYEPMVDTEWKTAQQTGVKELMPREEVTANDHVYDLISRINSGAFDIFHAINRAREFNLIDPDLSHLTRPQIDEQIELTEACATTVYEWGIMLGSLGQDFPDFGSGPTREDRRALSGLARSPEDVERLLPAQKLTDARLKALHDAYSATDKTAPGK